MAENRSETAIRFALTFGSGLAWSEVNALTQAWGADGARALEELPAASPAALREAGLSERQTTALATALRLLPAATREMQSVELAGLHALAPPDDDYPVGLSRTLGPARPPLLFHAGAPRLFNRPAVSIIGARQARPESLEFAKAAASAAVRAGLLVASGFAEGVDRAASLSALRAGGATLVFLPVGLLAFSPRSEDAGPGPRLNLTAATDAGALLIVSCFAPRAGWHPAQALQRNALITAMSTDTIAAQAGPTGGTWEASRGALRQKKRLWVREDHDPSLGHDALVQMGARATPWPNDQMDAWLRHLAQTAAEPRPESPAPWTDAKAARFLGTASPSEIHERTGITGALLARLMEGRATVKARALRDFLAINGIGESALRQIAEAFGIQNRIEAVPEPSLFPDLETPAAPGKAQPAPPPPSAKHRTPKQDVADSTPEKEADEDLKIFALGNLEPAPGPDPAKMPENKLQPPPPKPARKSVN